MIVDAHAHVFRPASVLPRAVDELAPAQRDAPVEDLLATMEVAGVERAVLVPLGTEDEYVASVLADHPGHFAAIAVADEAILEGDVAALDARRAEFPFHGVRTQWLGEPGRPLEASSLLPVLRAMAERGLVLWTYLAPGQLPLLGELPAAVPELRIVLNHLGFCPHDMRVDAHGRPSFEDPFPDGSLEPVLALAEHEHAHVMFSGHYALSAEDPPYRDLDLVVSRLFDAYGAGRMLWASDYPWTRDVPGYASLLELAPPGATRAGMDAIHGGTALKLFPHLGPV